MDFEENHLKQGVCTSEDYKNKINLSLKYITTIYKCILCKGEFKDPSTVLDHLKVNHLDTIIVPITKQENMDEELLESNSKRNQEIKVKAAMEFHSKSRLSILILIFWLVLILARNVLVWSRKVILLAPIKAADSIEKLFFEEYSAATNQERLLIKDLFFIYFHFMILDNYRVLTF